LYEENIRTSSPNFKRSQISFKEALLLKDFSKAYKKLNTEKERSIGSRTALEEEYNFTIVEGRDINLLEIDGKTYYNILIKRDIENLEYFENLLILVEGLESSEETSAFIIKYNITSETIYSSTETIDKDLTVLYSRVAQLCYTTCTAICTTEGTYEGTTYSSSHPMSSTPICTFNHLQCEDECVDDIGGGYTGTGSGIGQSGGGPTGSGSPNPDPTNPPNENGQTNNPPPLELILDPVVDEPTIDPCIKMNLLKNDVVFKQKLGNLKTQANTAASQPKEMSFVRTLKTNPTPTDNFNYAQFLGPPGANFVNSSYVAQTLKGIDHCHNENGLPIFSLGDLKQGGEIASNANVNVGDLVFTLVTKHQTTYAYQITDKNKFIAFYESYLKVGGKVEIFAEQFLDKYKIKLESTNTENETGFVKLIRDYDLGITLFRGDYNNFNSWKKLTIDKNGGTVIPIECN
jgi:hypothetical protein